MKNKEAIYDELLAPKLAEVGDLCLKHDIPFFAVAQYSETDSGETVTAEENKGETSLKFRLLRYLASQGNGKLLNIDGLIEVAAKYYMEKRIPPWETHSIVMMALAKVALEAGK